MANQYLDMAGLQTLVGQIKAEDTKALTAAKEYSDEKVGSLIKGETTYDDMRSYVDAQVSAVESGATEETTYSTTVTKQVGGLNVGDDISNKSLKEVLDLILSPYVATSSVSVQPYNNDNFSGTTFGGQLGQGYDIKSVKVSWSKGSTQVTKVEVFKDSVADANKLGEATVSSGTSVSINTTDIEVASAENITTTTKIVAKVYDKNGEKGYTGERTVGSYHTPYWYGLKDITAGADLEDYVNGLTADDIKALTKVSSNYPAGKITFGNTSGKACILATVSTVNEAKDPNGFPNFSGFKSKDIEITDGYMKKTYHIYVADPGAQTGWYYTFS